MIQAQSGDVQAFARLVGLYWPKLVRFAHSVIGDLDAEDCAQDALVTAWRKLPGLKNPEALFVWLIRITVRICIRRSRYRRVFLPISSFLTSSEPMENEIVRGLDVEGILTHLAPRQRAVMHLTVIDGMTDSEIAIALNITASSVRSHRRRAREALLKWIPDPGYPIERLHDGQEQDR